MIPVGTLCEIVEAPPSYPAWLGKFTTVVAHDPPWHVVDIDPPSELDLRYRCLEQRLRPIVPPGDPDKVDEPVREPEEAFR